MRLMVVRCRRAKGTISPGVERKELAGEFSNLRLGDGGVAPKRPSWHAVGLMLVEDFSMSTFCRQRSLLTALRWIPLLFDGVKG